MASSSSFISFVGFFVILQLSCCCTLYAKRCYPSIISFGNSLADTGNLKQLANISHQRVLFFLPPYGKNFINQSTGRCSNGRLFIDFLATSLALPLIPAFLSKNGSDNAAAFKQGVNYAVAGATSVDSSILEEKGIKNPFTNASLGVQLAWFKQSLSSICGKASDCRKFIGRSLILMGEIGPNDYNYALLFKKPINEIEVIVPLVISSIISAVNDLIKMGARTLLVPGNPPFGCSAAHLTTLGSKKDEYDPTTGCLIKLNKFSEYHNKLLQTKLNEIRRLYPNVKIIYADYYNASMQIYRSPDKFGFTNGALKACCGGIGPFNFNLFVQCGNIFATVCDQPDTYVSWDGLHLTEMAYKQIYNILFKGPYTIPQFNSSCITSA